MNVSIQLLKVTLTKLSDTIKVWSVRLLREPQGYSEVKLKIAAFKQ